MKKEILIKIKLSCEKDLDCKDNIMLFLHYLYSQRTKDINQIILFSDMILKGLLYIKKKIRGLNNMKKEMIIVKLVVPEYIKIEMQELSLWNDANTLTSHNVITIKINKDILMKKDNAYTTGYHLTIKLIRNFLNEVGRYYMYSSQIEYFQSKRRDNLIFIDTESMLENKNNEKR